MTNRLSYSLLVFATFANCAAVAAPSEQFCTYRGKNPDQGDSVACYSDAGCRFAATLGAEPIRDFDVESAPYALARGKITAVIASSPSLIGKVKQVGGISDASAAITPRCVVARPVRGRSGRVGDRGCTCGASLVIY
jgi:hypothetical protein